ncbi:hypothetical protein J6590_037095 [Homalodisca vitripennis]|nr:hypothetical protein J6590_037095 [Homalodisca vitripennis]
MSSHLASHPDVALVQEDVNITLESSKKLEIKLFHQNVQVILPKFSLLEVMLEVTSPHILCVSEHFLKRAELDAFKLAGFSVASSYCCGVMRRGGVSILVRGDLDFVAVGVSNFCTEGYCVSDHHAQLAHIQLSMHSAVRAATFRMKRLFNKVNVGSLRGLLTKESWTGVFLSLDVDSKVSALLYWIIILTLPSKEGQV